FLIVDGKQGGNWAPTRYIPWTSFKAAKSVWSFTSSYTAKEGDNTGLEPGTRWRISCQSEDNGMGTYAHEFGHISGISDNYVSAYTDPPQRTPAGTWELMNGGNQNGPGGTHGRYTIPARKGDVIPAEHTVRLKVKQGFYDEGQANRFSQEYLVENGPVFETVVARNVPTTGKYGVGYGVNGMILDLTEDKTPIIKQSSPDYVWNNVATYGSGVDASGYYQNYGIEVIQKTGYESFLHDEGVLISMYRDRESAPFIWMIDSHPEDINIVNFKHPGTGEDVYITKGENRQLNDALFHAGTGDDVVSEYVDEYNQLHFYVLDKMYDAEGVLSYRVAVRSDEFDGTYSDAPVVALGAVSPAKPGMVASQEILITNKGTQPALYRLSSSNEEGWAWGVNNEVVEVAPGETVSIPLYMVVTEFRAEANDFSFTVTSEVSGKEDTVEGTLVPEKAADPEHNTYEGATESVMPEFTGKDQKDMPDMDPVSWQVPEWMTWADWKDNPAIDWSKEDLPDADLQKGLLMLVDYADSPFIVTKPVGSDPMGNPQIQVDTRDLASFWVEFLNVPSEMNNYTSIDMFWRENSFGKWKVEMEAYGPYTLEGMEWEYGIDSFNGARSAKRAIRPEATELFLADKANHGRDLSDFTFGFIIHAGYDESGVWQEAG
ncbi:MAG: immune inhibitor A, partial [Firmicutes bacterium]|nr:immune inhibitor A [Bacillota bacterium]